MNPWEMNWEAPATAQQPTATTNPWEMTWDNPVVTTPEEVPAINAQQGFTPDGRDASGVPAGLSEQDVAPQGNPAVAPAAPVAPDNSGFSDAVRTGVNLVSGVTPAMKEQMDKAGVTPMGDYVADAIGGVANAPRNIAETGLAISDELSGGDKARSFNEVVPKYESNTEVGEMLTTGGEMAVGGLGAYKLAKESIKQSPKFIGWLSGLGAEATGAGAAASTNSDSFLIGEKSAFGNTSVGDDVVNNPILQKKIDLAADALVTAAPVAGLAEYGAKGLAIAKDLTFDRFVKFFSREAQNDQVAKSILSELGGITPDMTDDQIIAKFDQVIKTINDPQNKNLKDALEARITPEEFAKLTPEQQKVLDIDRDTVSAFEAGNIAGSAETAGARSLREGVIRTGAPDVQAAMAKPVVAADTYNKDLMTQAGGREAADEAASVVQQSGRDQVQRAQDVADDTVRALSDEANDVSKIITDDPNVGAGVNQIGTNVNINTSGPRDQVRTRIGGNLEAGYVADTQKLNDLAAAARNSGATVDEEILNSAGNEVLANKLLGTNDSKILQSFVDGDTNDFGELFAMTPALTKRIDELTMRGESHLAQPLIDLRNTINNPIGDGEEVAAFRDYFKNDWSKKYQDGIGKDVADTYQKTVATPRGADPFDKKPVNKEIGFDKAVDKGLSETPYTKQLKAMLDNPAAGNSSEDIGNLIVADSMESVQKTINRKGEFGPDDFDGVVSALEQNGAQLSAVAPEQAKRINALATRVRDRKIELGELKKEVDVIVKGAARAEKNILGRELAPFFKQDEVAGKFNEVTNGFKAFDTLMGDPQGHKKLQGVVDRVMSSDNELAKKGLQSAWQNSFRKRFFSVAEDGTGGAKVKSSFMPGTKDGSNELFTYGEKIYGDTPGVMTTIKALAEEADRISGARSSTSHMVQEGKNIANQGQSAFQMVTTFLFGPLSRTGSKVRSAGSKILEKSNPEEYLNRTMQAVLADPEEFNRIVKPFMNKQRKKVSAEDLKALTRWAVNTGVKAPEEAEMDTMQSDLEKDKYNAGDFLIEALK